MRSFLIAASFALTASACATFEAPVVTTVPDPAALAWSTAPGGNTIKGDALLRTRGGDVRTCAGYPTRLMPASDYTNEWASIFFAPTGSFRTAYLENLNTPPALSPEIEPFVRKTVCNAQGQFSFTDVPDGEYLLIARVSWEAPDQYGMATQGGTMMERVQVQGGQTVSLVMTRN